MGCNNNTSAFFETSNTSRLIVRHETNRQVRLLFFVFVGTTSTSAANPLGAPKQDPEIPPPPLQPVHQSASAAELSSNGREAEQQEEEQQQSSAQQQPQQPAATSQSQEAPAVSGASQPNQPQPSSKTEKPQANVGVASTPKQHQGAKAEIQQGKVPPVREASRLQKESKPEVLLYPVLVDFAVIWHYCWWAYCGHSRHRLISAVQNSRVWPDLGP